MRILPVSLAIAAAASAGSAQRVPVETRTATLVSRSTFAGELFLDRRESEFDSVRDVKVGKDGRIFVLYRARAFMFDAKGALLQKFDGQVNATIPPFVNPSSLELTDSTVTVRDTGARRLNTFRLNGKHLSSQRTTDGVALETRRRMRGGSTLVERSPQVSPLDSVPPGFSLVRSYSIQSGNALRPLFSIRLDTAFFVTARDSVVGLPDQPRAMRNAGVLARPVATRFGAGGAWAMSGDSLIAHADGHTGVVRWYAIGGGGASLVDSARFARPVRPITADDVADETERLQLLTISRAPRGTQPPRNPTKAELRGTPPVWSTATKALFSSDGSLWVGVNRIYARAADGHAVSVGDDNTWAVFPRDGNAYLVTLRPLLRVTAVFENRVYGYIEDGAAPAIEVYAVGSRQ